MRIFLTVISIIVYAISLAVQNYAFIYIATMVCLVLIMLGKNQGAKIMAFFYFLYFGLSTLNISIYRGTIIVETLTLYSLLILLSFVPFFVIKQNNNEKYVTQLSLSQSFYKISTLHIILVYCVTFYIFLSHGNVLINQAARFHISPTLGYIVKSSLIIPLFYPFFENKSRKRFFYFFILPILPTIFIGGRGTVLIIFSAYLIINFWKESYLKKKKERKRILIDKAQMKKVIIRFGIFGGFILFGLYYIRRAFNRELLNVSLLLKVYKFPSDSWIYVLILPLYTGFRETIGISNVLIEGKYFNTYSDVPLFFCELLTVLPIDIMAPGQILGQKVIGSTLDGGLTPGILGGLYIDYGNMAIFGGGIIMTIICIFYRSCKFNHYSLMIFALCFVQYLHLFHRGFLKLEYFSFIILLLIYFLFTVKRKVLVQP